MNKNDLLWYDRKRLWCGLPWTFTKYGLSEDRLFVQTGLFNTREMEARLYRVLNLRLDRSLSQRIFGLGTIHVDSSDKDLNCFELKNIRDCQGVKELLSEQVEIERKRNRVYSRENLHDGPEFEDEDVGQGGTPYD